jgi:hypothetical protein
VGLWLLIDGGWLRRWWIGEAMTRDAIDFTAGTALEKGVECTFSAGRVLRRERLS